MNLNNKTTVFGSILLAVLMIAILAAGTVSAADYAVNQTSADSGHDSYHENIKDAVTQANAGNDNTVTIYNGTYSGTNNKNISIIKNMTIKSKEGHTVILDAGNNGYFFDITTGCTVTFKGITFKNANNLLNGGAITGDSGTTIIVENSVFDNNKAAAPGGFNNRPSGGAIRQWNDGVIIIKNCEFSDNSASDSGGAIFQGINGLLDISNTVFTNNNAVNLGGAIYSGNYSTTKINNCTFRKNIAKVSDSTGSEFGGGAIFEEIGGTLNIISSRFEENEAKAVGGAIFISRLGELNIEDCNFTNNLAGRAGGAIATFSPKTSIKGSNFNSNIAQSIANQSAMGGAIYLNRGNLTIEDSKFNNNKVITSHDTGTGGAISVLNNGNLTVIATNFTENSAKNGGAIFCTENTPTVIISASNFTNNVASEYGGAILRRAGGSLDVINSIFNGNQAKEGLAIYNNQSTMTIKDNSQFINHNNNNATIFNNGNATIENSRINNNYLGIRNYGKLDISNSALSNNVYGAIATYSNNTKITNNELKNNGRAIIIGYSDSIIKLEDDLGTNTIENNEYALAIEGSRNKISQGTISNNINGILFTGSSNTLTNTTIINNNNTAIIVRGNDNTINYNRITGNKVGMNNSGSNTNGNLNWWGRNDAQSQVSNTGANFNMDYWYVIKLSANDFSTIVNASQTGLDSSVPVNLICSLDTNEEVINTPDLLPYFEVTVNGPNGETTTQDIRTTNISYVLNGLPNQTYSLETLADAEDLVLNLGFEGVIPPLDPEDPDDNGTDDPTPVPGPEDTGNNETNDPDDSSPAPADDNGNGNDTSNNPVVKATMKKTGIPLIAVLIVLLSMIGSTLGIYRKRD